MAVAVIVAVFGDVMPCSLADIHRRFRTIYCPLIRWNNIYPTDKEQQVPLKRRYVCIRVHDIVLVTTGTFTTVFLLQ